MSDDRANRDEPDRSRINLNEEYEVRLRDGEAGHYERGTRGCCQEGGRFAQGRKRITCRLEGFPVILHGTPHA